MLMMHSLLLITCACLLAACAAQNDTVVQRSGVYVKVLHNSGKIIIGWQQDVQADDRRVELTFTGLQELDNSLEKVKPNVATELHSFSDFSQQKFTVSSVQQATIGSSNSKTSFFTFSSHLAGLSTSLTATVYIMEQGGSLTLDGETTPLKTGDVKVTMEVSSWSWCSASTCRSEGAYLDMTLNVRSRGIPEKKGKDNSTGDADAYELGYGTLLLSKKVKVDSGSWQNMAANYPQLGTVGDNQVLHLRLPKFTQNVLYDPVVSGEMSDDETAAGSHVTVSSILLLILPVVCKMLSLY